MQNPYNSMSNGDLHIIYKDYVHSKETGNRCESFVPYAKEIKENIVCDYTLRELIEEARNDFFEEVFRRLFENMK